MTGAELSESRRPRVLSQLAVAAPSLTPVNSSWPVLEVRVASTEIEVAARCLIDGGSRFADLFVVAEGEDLVLRAVYALDDTRGYLIVSSVVEDGVYGSLSEVTPGAFVEECEAFEKFGVLPRGGRPLNRMMMPPHPDHASPPWGGRRDGEAREVRAPHVVQGDAIEFPFGPVRAAAWESLYMGLVTNGEQLIDLYLLMWHKHRGVERRLVGLAPDRALFFVERAEGLSAIGNGLAFCRALESIAGVEPPPAAAAGRALALELERLYNHAAAIVALCQATGLGVGQAQAEIALEELLRLNLATFGHRYLFNVLSPGGLRQEPDREAIRKVLPQAAGELRRVVDALRRTDSFVDRLDATGQITHEQAHRLALVGPVARASGCSRDTRRDHPFAPYDRLELEVASEAGGDALSRMGVFVAEIEESQRLAGELAEEAGSGCVALPTGCCGSSLGWAESPRGESLVWLALDREGTVQTARLRPGSARNWRAFDDAVRARNVFTDVPIIEASFWLTVAGFAR